jgi:tetratricopeptide (TPR) repeat protein
MPTPLVLLVFATTPNVDLEWAANLVHGVRYAAALEALKKAQAHEGNSAEQLAQIFELEGLAHAALKRPDEARKDFTRLLALNPQHHFASAQAPRVMTPYLEARSQVQQHGAIGLTTGPPELDGEKVAVKLGVSDFLGLGRTLVVKLVEDGVSRELTLAPEPSVRVEAKGERVELSAELLGERHASLAALPVQVLEAPKPVAVAPAPAPPVAAPEVVPPPPVVEARPERSRGKLISGLVLVGAAAAALGSGAYLGLRAQGLRAQYNAAIQQSVITLTYGDAMALQRTVQGDAVLANILFIAGGAAAVAGVSLTIAGLVVSPTPAGVSVSGAMP